jgi:hypothetical protein
MGRTYQKPSVATIEIPERTSYACNVGSSDPFACSNTSAISGHGICTSDTAFKVVGTGC